jgi:hypothetical protein
MNLNKILKRVMVSLYFISAIANAAPNNPLSKMKVVDVYDAGQPGGLIVKLYDETDDIFCYILMSANVGRKQVNGVLIYDGNNLGSISCAGANKKQDIKRK